LTPPPVDFDTAGAVPETPLTRALSDAPDRPRAQVARPDEELFIVRIGELSVGVSSEHVREVTRVGSLTPLPRTPSFVLGVVGHRGEVFPLIDLLRFLGLGEARPSARSRLFVSHLQTFVVGFLADEVIGLRRVLLADKVPPPSSVAHAEYLDGVVNSRDLGTVTVLNLARIVQAARQKVSAR
jgi:purine-binding chemotaxis protein CheW